MDADGFKVVLRRKSRQKFSKSKQPQQFHLLSEMKERQTTKLDEENDFSSSSSVLKILTDYREEIKSTSFYETFKVILLAKLHNGSKCGLHASSIPDSIQSNDLKTSSIIEPVYNVQKSSNEGSSFHSSEENPFADKELRIPKIQNSNEYQLEDVLKDAEHCAELNRLELVVYGIGNFAECLIARYQLALILALKNTLKLPQDHVSMFDPMLSDVEKSAIKELGLSLITYNEEGKRPVTGKHWTVFFMPHCGKALCNNLLWSNWSADQLSSIIIIGNSFSSLVERSPERLLKRFYYYMWKIHPVTDETSLPNLFKHSDVFNDTSVHTFPSMALSKLPEDFWVEHTEPVYDTHDLEIIVNKL